MGVSTKGHVLTGVVQGWTIRSQFPPRFLFPSVLCSPCPQLCKRGQPLPKYLRGCLEDLGVRNEALPIAPHPMGGTSSTGHPGSALYPQSSPVSDERGLGARLSPATDLGQGKAGGGLFLLVFVFHFSVQCHMLHYDINRKS